MNNKKKLMFQQIFRFAIKAVYIQKIIPPENRLGFIKNCERDKLSLISISESAFSFASFDIIMKAIW